MSDNDSDSDSSFATSPTFWKERLSNPKAAMDEYVTMYSSCFLPATSLYIYGSGPRVAAKQRVTRQCEERLAQRETRLVRAGAVRKQVDDMLEYALRLETGTHVLFDPDAALRLFKKVLDGPYPNETRAIAAMCSCYCLKRAMAIAVELFDPLEAFTFLNRGCELGLFAHCTLHLIHLYDGLKMRLHEKLPFSRLTALWQAYDMFRKENGYQRPKESRCQFCNFRPRPRSLLKGCAGHCRIERKPVYCSKECQKADWKRHRKWCLPSLIGPGSESEDESIFV